MNFEVNLGGGPKHGNCAARSVAIVTGLPYEDVYEKIYYHKDRLRSFMVPRSYFWMAIDEEFIGSKIAMGKIVCVLRCSNTPDGTPHPHYTAVVNGVIQDEYDVRTVWKHINLVGYWSNI